MAIISENTIYFSNPADFNDPWDCRPWYSAPTSESDRQKLVRKMGQAHRARFPNRSRTERRSAKKKHLGTPALIRKEVEKLSLTMWDAIQKRYRVYCLSEIGDCALMWSHYADHHRGVCLEFDCDSAALKSAMKVQYFSEYPPYNLLDGSELLPFIAKSNDWSYEREFRLVSEEVTEALSSKTLKTSGGLFKLPENAIRSVIVGAQAPPEIRQRIVSMVNSAPRSITVLFAHRSVNKYQINITTEVS